MLRCEESGAEKVGICRRKSLIQVLSDVSTAEQRKRDEAGESKREAGGTDSVQSRIIRTGDVTKTCLV